MAMGRRGSSGSGQARDGPTGHHRRVIVADDDVLVRGGLVHLLSRYGFEVVAQAGDGGQLIDLVAEFAPDLVVVDNRMPPTWTTEGVEIAGQIREQFPSVGILVLSASVDVAHALELLFGGGPVGYLLKSQIAEVGQLVDALEQISMGGSVIDPSLVRELVAAYGSDDPLTKLSAHEHEMLAQMAQGRSDVGIARALGMTKTEVGRQAHRVFAKLRLPESVTDRHRALAVLAYLEAR
jgi:DNA-binding NarL/FixJ family response regulator